MPQKLMPRVKESGQYVDIIMNGSTMYGRENPGQIFEMSINRVGSKIVRYIVKNNLSVDDSLAMIVKFTSLISPDLGQAYTELFSKMSYNDKRYFLDSVIQDGHIDLSTKPITDSFDIDRLNNLYKEFPFIHKDEIEVPIQDSNGNYRYITAHRKMVVGEEYFFRLKQYAEEKFSATSLSAVNIRGNNTKSKANKNFIEPYSNTPIRFGNMEINSMSHLGVEAVVTNLMIHSVSPHARELVSQMYTTSDPYHVNIMLDGTSKNRGAEVVYAYLKTIGRKLVFEKVPKKRVKISISPVYFTHPAKIQPVFFRDKGFNFDQYYKDTKELRDQIDADKAAGKKVVQPVWFDAADPRHREEERKANEEAYKFIKTPLKDREKFLKEDE